jgi:hypothetical protein
MFMIFEHEGQGEEVSGKGVEHDGHGRVGFEEVEVLRWVMEGPAALQLGPGMMRTDEVDALGSRCLIAAMMNDMCR